MVTVPTYFDAREMMVSTRRKTAGLKHWCLMILLGLTGLLLFGLVVFAARAVWIWHEYRQVVGENADAAAMRVETLKPHDISGDLWLDLGCLEIILDEAELDCFDH